MEPTLIYRRIGDVVYKKTTYDEDGNIYTDECLGIMQQLADGDEPHPSDVLVEGYWMRPETQQQPEPQGQTQAERIAQLESDKLTLQTAVFDLYAMIVDMQTPQGAE